MYPASNLLTHRIAAGPFKGSLQWKNDLGLYFTLVLVMKIGMCDLMIFCLLQKF